jgi:hypothetical protein
MAKKPVAKSAAGEQPKRGRPSSFTPELAREICLRMAAGENLNQVCRDPRMPDRTTVAAWVVDDVQGFAKQYREARDRLLEFWADELIEISDDSTNDWIKREHESGRAEVLCDHEHINRSRLRADNRKWLLSKLKPGEYGDKTTVNLNANTAPNAESLSDTSRWLASVLGGPEEDAPPAPLSH